MRVQYLNKIKDLSNRKDISKNYNHTDLDNFALKIALDDNKFYFNLSDLEFINDQQNEDSEEINKMADCLGLQWIKTYCCGEILKPRYLHFQIIP